MQNPNPIFKITICFTKTPKHQNTIYIFDFFSKIENCQKSIFLFCNMYKWYNSYFVIFGFFVNILILGFLDFRTFTLHPRISLQSLMRHWRQQYSTRVRLVNTAMSRMQAIANGPNTNCRGAKTAMRFARSYSCYRYQSPRSHLATKTMAPLWHQGTIAPRALQKK